VNSLLIDTVIIFTLSVAAAIICHRMRVPTPIGLLLAGVLAGPDVLRLVSNVRQIELVSEIGVVLLLFVVGLEFSVADLLHMRRQFTVGGSAQFFGTMAVIGLGTWALGSTPAQSLFIGGVVALSSTALVLRLLQDRAELGTPHGRTILAVLVYQDLAVVPLMLMAPLLAGTSAETLTADAGGLLLRVTLVAVLAYVGYRWVVSWILERIVRTRSSEAFLLGVLSICLGIALLTQSLGLSLALGAFLAGFIISRSDYSHQAVTLMLPFRDIFMSLFFVSIGMLLDVQYLLDNPVRLLGLTLGVILVKPIVAGASALLLGLPLRNSVIVGLSLGQVGEFSLVATQAGVAAGLLGQEVFQTVLDTAVLSMVLAPALFAFGPPSAEFLARTPLRRLELRGFRTSKLVSAHEYSGHVLIIGFGVTGRNLARTARLSEIPYAIVDLNPSSVRDAARDGEPIYFGDATHEAVLRLVDADKARAIVVVVDDPAGARRIVELSRRIAPDAYIIVRSRYLAEVQPLHSIGADEVIADELEVSIELFSRVLSRMLVPREDIKRLIGEVRQDWRRMARTFAKETTAVHDLRLVVPDLTTHTLRLTDDSPLIGLSIAESRLRRTHGVTVLAVSRSEETIGNPPSATVLLSGDVLFVIGPPDWEPQSVA